MTCVWPTYQYYVYQTVADDPDWSEVPVAQCGPADAISSSNRTGTTATTTTTRPPSLLSRAAPVLHVVVAPLVDTAAVIALAVAIEEYRSTLDAAVGHL